MTSAAGASAVPGALEASTRAATRSFFTSFLTGTQLVERGQRQCSQSLHDELGARELFCRVAARDRDQSEPGAACRFETPPRVFDRHRASRIKAKTCALAQLLE